jgi:hypothetical protein
MVTPTLLGRWDLLLFLLPFVGIGFLWIKAASVKRKQIMKKRARRPGPGQPGPSQPRPGGSAQSDKPAPAQEGTPR